MTQLHRLMAAHVETGNVPGLVMLVADGDDAEIDVIGTPAFDDPTPLSRDAIFRIASITKPITAAATMSMVDDGTLRLDQPVDDLLPELANRRVLRRIDAELDDTVAAERSITVEDLLTLRLGFGTVMAAPGEHPIQRAEDDLALRSIGGPPWPPTHHDPDSWMAALGSLPLMHQPGERWLYNTGAQVLGVLIARAAATDLPTVVQERVLDPLGMVDTAFTVPAEKLERLTTYYSSDEETGATFVVDEPTASWWGTPTSFPDASGWLTSSIDDLWRFSSMLRAGGTLAGERVLSPAAVARMLTDHLTASQRAGSEPILGPHEGWGLGIATAAAGSGPGPMPRGYGWDGGSGTSWRTDPTSGRTGILLTQRALTSPSAAAVFDDFWAGVNASEDGR